MELTIFSDFALRINAELINVIIVKVLEVPSCSCSKPIRDSEHFN